MRRVVWPCRDRGKPGEVTEGAQGKDDAVRAAKNEVVLRHLNERLKAYPASLGQRFSEWVCECADMTCTKSVELSIDEYEMIRAESTRFVVAPGAEHVNPEIERVVQREERYWVVKKIGVGAEISEEFDPRS
jgi:hypothetical protein